MMKILLAVLFVFGFFSHAQHKQLAYDHLNHSEVEDGNWTTEKKVLKDKTLDKHPFLLTKSEKSKNDIDWVPMWNGTDFSGWIKFLGKPHESLTISNLKGDRVGKYDEALGYENDPLEVFKIIKEDEQSVIKVSGQIFGTLSTDKIYENYHLRLQFKWGDSKYAPRAKEQRDSGLLFHCFENNEGRQGSPWPNSMEFQIQETDLGDFWVVGTELKMDAPAVPFKNTDFYKYHPKGKLRTAQHKHEPKKWSDVRIAKYRDNERKHGEWNDLELICFGDRSIFVLNGVVVNRLYNSSRKSENGYVPHSKGQIALQSEGAEILFREIYIRKILEIPKAFQEK